MAIFFWKYGYIRLFYLKSGYFTRNEAISPRIGLFLMIFLFYLKFVFNYVLVNLLFGYLDTFQTCKFVSLLDSKEYFCDTNNKVDIDYFTQ